MACPVSIRQVAGTGSRSVIDADAVLANSNPQARADIAGLGASTMVLLGEGREGAGAGRIGAEREVAATTTGAAVGDAMGRVHSCLVSGMAASETDPKQAADDRGKDTCFVLGKAGPAAIGQCIEGVERGQSVLPGRADPATIFARGRDCREPS